MAKLVTAVVVEPRWLIREALVSLLKNQSYEIVGSSASLDVYDPGTDAPMLVVLGGLPPTTRPVPQTTFAVGGPRRGSHSCSTGYPPRTATS